MCPLQYYPMLRRSKEPTYLCFELVRYAREHGIKAAARQCLTTGEVLPVGAADGLYLQRPE